MRGALGMVRRDAGGVGDAVRVNVTPMIDVVMVLIIFFLLVGRLAGERLSPVDLASAAGGAPADGAGDEVTLTAVMEQPGVLSVRVDGRATDTDSIAAEIIRARGTDGAPFAVRLRAEWSVPYERLRPLVAACRQAGAAEIHLASLDLPGVPR
ncbi:MAG: biopolymer transporter ExbD [Planctomycetota bacterium]